MYINDSLANEILFAVGQPTEEIRYNADDELTLDVEMAVINLNVLDNFVFQFTQATEISEHNTDPGAHPEWVTAMKKAGIFLPAGAVPFERRGQVFEDANGLGVEFDGAKASVLKEGVTFTATFNGTELNTKDIAPDGIKTVDALRLEFNAANFPNTVEHDGVGTEVLSAGATLLASGTYNVAEKDLVYRDTDDVFKKALADGSIASKVVGVAYLADKCIVTHGLVDINTGETTSTSIFLSGTTPGQYTTFDTNVNIGIVLGNFIYFSGFPGDVKTSSSQDFDAIVSNGAGLGIYPTTQQAINAVPTNSRILIDKLEDVKTTISTMGKSLDFVFNGVDRGWQKFAGLAASFRVDFDSVPDNGTWRFEWNGQESGDLLFNDVAATIQTEFNLFSGHTGVIVTGDYTAGFVFTFLDGIPQPLPTFIFAGLNEIQRFNFSNVPDNGTVQFEFEGQPSLNFPWDDSAADLKIALEALSTINSVDVTGSFATNNFEVEFTGIPYNSDGLQPQQEITVIMGTLDLGGSPTFINGVDPQVAVPISPVAIQQGKHKANNLRIGPTAIVLTITEVSTGEAPGPETAITLDAPNNRMTGYGLIKDFTIGVDVNGQDETVVSLRFDNVLNPIAGGDRVAGTTADFSNSLGFAKDVFSQMRMTEHPTNKKRLKISTADVVLPTGVDISQNMKGLLLSFDGAEIDFSTGSIFESDGTTPLGINFTPIIPAAQQFRFASIQIIPDTVLANNTFKGQVRVLFGSADGASEAVAPRAALGNEGLSLGQVALEGDLGLQEISRIIADRDISTSLDADYFILEDDVGTVAFWYDIDNSGTAEPAHGAARSVEITTVNEDDDPNTVASKTQTFIDGDSKFSASVTTNRIIVTDASIGPRADVDAGTTGFFVDVQQQGRITDPTGLVDITNFNIREIKGSGGAGANELSDLIDVSVTAPAENEILVYNFSNSRFENQLLKDSSLITDIRLGEAITVATDPKAVYVKIKKVITIDATNDKLKFNEGGGDFEITLTQGEYLYPYTILAAEIKTKMELAGSNDYDIILSEQNHRVGTVLNIGTFNLLASAANSILTTLGFGVLDLIDNASVYVAASIHTFIREPFVFAVNTDNDPTPPTLDDGFFTPVSDDHRSRSYVGLLTISGVLLDTRDIQRFGETGGLSFNEGDIIFTNGTLGELGTSTGVNGVRTGQMKNDSDIVIDVTDMAMELDTDIEPNSVLGVLTWEESPELMVPTEDDVSFHSCGADGINVVTTQISTEVGGELVVAYSINKGKTWKKATFNNVTIGPATRTSGSWNNTSHYYRYNPVVNVDGDKVFIGYVYYDGSFDRIRGVLGQIIDGELNLTPSNEFESSPYVGSISDTGFSSNVNRLRIAKHNNVLYLTYFSGNGSSYKINKSMNDGLSWSQEAAVKSNSTNIQPHIANSQQDAIPQYLVALDIPGQTISPTELLNNGDLNTGDTTGWVDTSLGGSNGTFSVNGDNQLVITNPVGFSTGIGYQSFPTTIGKTYILTYDVISDPDIDSWVAITNSTSLSPFVERSLRHGKGTQHSLVFNATASTSFLHVSQQTSGSRHADTIFDNFSVKEIAENRLGVFYVVEPASDTFDFRIKLAWTDDQDVSNNWESRIILSDLLNSGLNYYDIPIGIYQDSNNKVYLHVILGHNVAGGVGSNAIANKQDADKSVICEMDMSLATPAEDNIGTVNWGQELQNTNGFSTFDNNGMFMFNSFNNIIKFNGNFYLVITTIGQSHLALITDINDISNSFHLVKTSENEALADEQQLVTDGSKLFNIQKLTTAFADNLTEGKVVAQEFSINTTAKPDEVDNGDFAVDLTSWIAQGAGGGSTIWEAGELKITTPAGVTGSNVELREQQLSGLTIGQTYELIGSVRANSGTPAWGVFLSDNSFIASDFFNLDKRVVSNIDAGQATTSTRFFRGSFVATKTDHYIQLQPGSSSNIFWFDNISIKESPIQIQGLPDDIADKPNIDDQGFAGRFQVISKPTGAIAHVIGEKEMDIGNSTGVENLFYNNFGSKTIQSFEAFKTGPIELNDLESSDVHMYGVGRDGNNVVVAYQTAASQSLQIHFSLDGGDSWTKATGDLLDSGFTSIDTNFMAFSPVISVQGNSVVIVYSRTGTDARSAYGTIASGVLSMTAPATDLLSNGAQLSIARRGDNIYIFGLLTAVLYINKSVDGGVTWQVQDFAVVKDGGSNWAANTASPIKVFITSDPDIPANDRVIVLSSHQSNGNLTVLYTDDQDLTANWETGIPFIANVGGLADMVASAVLSPNGTKIAILGFNTNIAPAQVMLNQININTTLITLVDVDTGININDSGVLTSTNNGEGTANTIHYMQQSNQLKWKTDTSLYAAWITNTGDGGIYFRKIHDTTNVAGAGAGQFVKPANSGNEHFTPYFIESPSGRTFLSYRFVDSVGSLPTVLQQGRIVAKEISDPTPTTSTTPGIGKEFDLINKSSVTTGGFAGRYKISGPLLITERENANGIESLYINSIQYRQFNEEVEEFSQVPVKVTGATTDIRTWGFGRSGKFILIGANRDVLTKVWSASADNGKTWFELNTIPGIGPNNTTDYFKFPDAVHVYPDGKFVVVHHVFTGGLVKVKAAYGQILDNGSFTLTPSNSDAVIHDPGVGTRELKVIERDGVLLAFSNDESDDLFCFKSVNQGQTWATPVLIDNDVTNDSPYAVHTVDNGVGGNRFIAIFMDKVGTRALVLKYSDDDGANWSSQQTIIDKATNDMLYGFGVTGNKIGISSLASGDISELWLTVCDDLVNSGAAPVFNTPVDIADGIGNIATDNGHTANSLTLNEFGKLTLNKIVWLTSNSLMVGYDRRNGAQDDGMVSIVPDTTTIVPVIKTVFPKKIGSESYTECQLLKSDSGGVFLIQKSNDDSGANNLTKGRLYAREIFSDGSLGEEVDIGFKPDHTVGGFIGRHQIKGNTVLFEKEDGGSIEQLYFNSIELRRVQKGK